MMRTICNRFKLFSSFVIRKMNRKRLPDSYYDLIWPYIISVLKCTNLIIFFRFSLITLILIFIGNEMVKMLILLYLIASAACSLGYALNGES